MRAWSSRRRTRACRCCASPSSPPAVGLPAGALNIVTGLGSEAGAALVEHPGVEHISFTGSPATGTWVAAAAAKRHCPVTLELGGKSPQIVFADADLDAALPALVNAIVQNAGQTCSAGSRLLVEQSRYEEVLARLGERFAALKTGPALGRSRLRAAHSRLAVAARARVPCRRGEGRHRDRRARHASSPMRRPAVSMRRRRCCATFRPTTGWPATKCSGRCWRRCPFVDEADAVRLANATDFGLVAGVWTQDGGRQLRMARAVQSGQVFINNYGAGGGVELPFGGVKHSGYGREKGFEALHGFTTLKTVVIKHG